MNIEVYWKKEKNNNKLSFCLFACFSKVLFKISSISIDILLAFTYNSVHTCIDSLKRIKIAIFTI